MICFFSFALLVIKGPVNTWGCKDGSWIKFGNLDIEKPNRVCGLTDTIKGKILFVTESYRLNSKILNTEKYSNQGLENVPPELLYMLDTVVIKLDNNQLSVLPDKFYELNKVKELYLDHNNIVEISQDIGKLSNLEKLDLSHNSLSDIPKEMGELKKLRRLDLSKNKLKDFPEEFYSLSTNLENLDIFGNNFNDDFIIILQEKLPNTTINF